MDVLTYASIGVAGLVAVSIWKRSELEHIPSVGYSGYFPSFITGFSFFIHAKDLVKEGYEKFPSAVYKIAMPDKLMVVVSGRTLVEELRKAPEDVLSFDEGANDIVQLDEIMGHAVYKNPYHVRVIQKTLTRNLVELSPAVYEETALAFQKALTEGSLSGDGWISVPAVSTVQKIVSQVSNRVFVGAPLCRDKSFQQLNVDFTLEFVKTGSIIGLFPPFTRSTLKRLFPGVPQKLKEAQDHLEPVITDRRRQLEEQGPSYPDKPQDMLSWLLDHEDGREASIEDLTKRILLVNFAAIHTTSMTFTHALYTLAAFPEYQQPLREEVEEVLKGEGWTKAATGQMRKLDSFLRESTRINGIGCFGITRKSVQPFTFSDGTFIPVGTTVSAASSAIHHDELLYPDSENFDGFRFSKLRDGEGMGTKYGMVTTSPEYLPFGHGTHACPGRFFAAQEILALMAHVVTTYDVKLVKEGVRPENMWIAAAQIPNASAHVLFRKR